MNPTNQNHEGPGSYTKEREMLRTAGFAPQEIEKLCRLRAKREQEMYRHTIAQNSPSPQNGNWLGNLMKKLLTFCSYAADCEAEHWVHTHFPY